MARDQDATARDSDEASSLVEFECFAKSTGNEYQDAYRKASEQPHITVVAIAPNPGSKSKADG